MRPRRQRSRFDLYSHEALKFAGSAPRSRSPSPVDNDVLTLRSLVSTKDAGVIIGKAGKNVADLRDQTGVKAGVSKVIAGVHERVLTVSGSVESVAKVYILLGRDKSPLTRFSGIRYDCSAARFQQSYIPRSLEPLVTCLCHTPSYLS